MDSTFVSDAEVEDAIRTRGIVAAGAVPLGDEWVVIVTVGDPRPGEGHRHYAVAYATEDEAQRELGRLKGLCG